tara:strand:+ start:10602 stop:10919 length:318 start_codon:yes stop_codon:yes gene_type:complete
MLTQPEELEAFLRELANEPRTALISRNVKVGAGETIRFNLSPAKLADEVHHWMVVDDDAEMDVREEQIRKFAESLDIVSKSKKNSLDMPLGAVKLGEKQLKRIVG